MRHKSEKINTGSDEVEMNRPAPRRHMVHVFLLTAEPTFSYFYNWLDERTNEIKCKYIAAEFTKEKNIT